MLKVELPPGVLRTLQRCAHRLRQPAGDHQAQVAGTLLVPAPRAPEVEPLRLLLRARQAGAFVAHRDAQVAVDRPDRDGTSCRRGGCT